MFILILSQTDLINAPLTYSFQIRFNIILKSKHISSSWSLTFKFTNQKAVYIFLLPHTSQNSPSMI